MRKTVSVSCSWKQPFNTTVLKKHPKHERNSQFSFSSCLLSLLSSRHVCDKLLLLHVYTETFQRFVFLPFSTFLLFVGFLDTNKHFSHVCDVFMEHKRHQEKEVDFRPFCVTQQPRHEITFVVAGADVSTLKNPEQAQHEGRKERNASVFRP